MCKALTQRYDVPMRSLSRAKKKGPGTRPGPASLIAVMTVRRLLREETKEIRIQQEKEDADDLREMTGNVKNWITERRENSIAEQKTAKIDRVAWNKKNKFIKGK